MTMLINPHVFGVSGSSHLFEDDFNRVALNANGDWSVYSVGGSASIISNQLEAQGLNGTWVSYVGSLIDNADHYCEADVTQHPSAGLGLLVRFTDNDNNYLGDINPSINQYRILKRISSTYTVLATLDETIPTPTYRVRFEVNGTDLELSVDTGAGFVSKLTASDASISTGTTALLGVGASGVGFDNFAAGNT